MPGKQAVLLIHGIGEQRPMSTLRGFVDAVWTRNEKIHHPHINAAEELWSKPDSISGNFELRRLTTPKNRANIRTDFFEFYWAHLMRDTTLPQVGAWASALLLRSPASVPKHLRLLWAVLVALLLLTIGGAVYAHQRWEHDHWLMLLFSVVIGPALTWVLTAIVGDAARYLNPAPGNIQARTEIRKAGIAVLRELHAREYDRIIVVGHSLGSVIGYDVLTHYWVEHHMTAPGVGAAAEALEECARTGKGDTQKLQRAYFNKLREAGCGWLVTDFVTAGSPLAHAEILMAHNADDFQKRVISRELPRCLPQLEKTGFTFGNGTPHHAAVFAPVRWTNLYFPNCLILGGDLVGGPLRRVFGEGINDVEVSTSQRFGLLSHTLYWSMGGETSPAHVEALRNALDLADDRR